MLCCLSEVHPEIDPFILKINKKIKIIWFFLILLLYLGNSKSWFDLAQKFNFQLGDKVGSYGGEQAEHIYFPFSILNMFHIIHRYLINGNPYR